MVDGFAEVGEVGGAKFTSVFFVGGVEFGVVLGTGTLAVDYGVA